MNILGPQWLCDCNTSGAADTVEEAAKAGGEHFMSHEPGESSISVAVYRSRGDWLYTISTREQAEKVAHPLREVMYSADPPLTTLTASAQAAGQYFEAFKEALNGRSSAPVPVQMMQSVRKLGHNWRPGQPIELGLLTREEADAQFRATFDPLALARKGWYVNGKWVSGDIA